MHVKVIVATNKNTLFVYVYGMKSVYFHFQMLQTMIYIYVYSLINDEMVRGFSVLSWTKLNGCDFIFLRWKGFYENEWIGSMKYSKCLSTQGLSVYFSFRFFKAPFLSGYFVDSLCAHYISAGPTIASYIFFSFFCNFIGNSVNRPSMHLRINKTIPFIALNFLWHIRIKSHFIMSGIFMLRFYFILFYFFLFGPNLCDVK